jgi:hypothetical protein
MHRGDASVRACVYMLVRAGDLDVLTFSQDGRVAWYENNGARPPAFQEFLIAVHTGAVSTLNQLQLVDAVGSVLHPQPLPLRPASRGHARCLRWTAWAARVAGAGCSLRWVASMCV